MKAPERPDHRALADALRRRVLEGPGETSSVLRQAVALSAAVGRLRLLRKARSHAASVKRPAERQMPTSPTW